MNITDRVENERRKVKSYANVAPLPFTEGGHNPLSGPVTRLLKEKNDKDPTGGVNDMRSKLEIQREVNKELKRLLVASVGEELQAKFDQLVSERASLSSELDKSVQQLTEGSEQLECVAIQCDVWRSKFIASQLMIDELMNQKANVIVEHEECQKAVNKLLEEHCQLYRQLYIANSHLKQLATMATSKKLSERPHVLVRPIQMPIENHNLLELGEENRQLSVDLARTSDAPPLTHSNSVNRSLTSGEQMATQLLNVRDDKMAEKQLISTVLSPSLSSTIRAFLSSRQDHTDIKYKCCRCKGQVFVV